jgi:hypothetical protein
LLAALTLKLFVFKLSLKLVLPPASITRIKPAAISQMFKSFWKYPSYLPDATYAKSKAAHPDFLMLSLN